MIETDAGVRNNQSYRQVAIREFNAGTIIPLWHVVFADRYRPDFTLPDSQVKLAQAANMQIDAQTLVYSYFIPDWLKFGSFARNQCIDIMRTNIKTVMGRYPEDDNWNVVNEAGLAPPFAGPWEFFLNTIGSDYGFASLAVSNAICTEELRHPCIRK